MEGSDGLIIAILLFLLYRIYKIEKRLTILETLMKGGKK